MAASILQKMAKVGLFLTKEKLKAELKKHLAPEYQLVELTENSWQQKAASLTVAFVAAAAQNWPKKLKEAGCGGVIVLGSEEELAQVDYNYIDDFIVLPLKASELRLRLARLLTGEQQKKLLQVEDLVIDTAKYEVLIAGQPLELTFKEYELLRFLVSHPERVWTRQSLLNKIWEYDYFGGTRTVDVHIRRLRAKLGPKYSEYLQTVRHVGYKWSGVR
jgi:DNA-binding response OmpR family regulator